MFCIAGFEVTRNFVHVGASEPSSEQRLDFPIWRKTEAVRGNLLLDDRGGFGHEGLTIYKFPFPFHFVSVFR